MDSAGDMDDIPSCSFTSHLFDSRPSQSEKIIGLYKTTQKPQLGGFHCRFEFLTRYAYTI